MLRIRQDGHQKQGLKLPGNMPFEHITADERLSGHQLALGGSEKAVRMELEQPPNLVINAICCPECSTRALGIAAKLVAGFRQDNIPVLNHPDMVLQSARDSAPRLFADIDGLLVPPTQRLNAPRLKTVLQLLDSGSITYPFIIRTTADHNGANMVRVMNKADLENLDVLPFDGRDYYVIGYVDYRDQQGHFRKFRLVKAGTDIIARQVVTSDEWNVHASHYHDKEINQNSEVQELRQNFLTDPFSFLGPEKERVIRAIFERAGLDFAGIDFSILPDGRIVLFECNACMLYVGKSRKDEQFNRNELRIKDEMVRHIIASASMLH
jgi:hypothetical protein